MTLSKDNLISLITEAFKGVKLEDGIGLSEAEAMDNYANDKERSKCRENDEKNYWSAISSEELNRNNCSLSYFDAKGMRFHLPAFMLAEINREYRFNLLFTFTNRSEHTRKQFSLLNVQQRETVKLFLEYISELPDYKFDKEEICEAINNYWSK